MDSDFNWSDIVIPALTFDSKTFLSQRYSHEPDHSLAWIENHRKAYLIPAEIYSEIFLYTVQAAPYSRVNLVLVCRQWHQIMLSTPGIHSQLRISNWTTKKDVERFGRRWYLDVTIDISPLQHFNPEEFFESFTTAAQAASRWRSLRLVTFPPPEKKFRDLQIALPLQHLETFKLAPSCNLGKFLEPLMTTITATVTPRLTVMEVLHPDAAPYLVQPAHFHIFSSLTTLKLICRRMQNPVDILPYLHKLETFEAHHLFLPIHSPGVDLSMIQTLRVLRLKSVSVQWMADQIFPALQECSIVFPHHADAIQSVHMPSCSILEYDANNLGALEHIRLSTLARLEVKCGQWRTWHGTLQLATLHPIFASQSLTILRLQIKCSEKLLVYMLELIPTLRKLWMGLSNPHALSSAFFLAFADGGCDATEKVRTSSQTIPRLCRDLEEVHLHYKRWLRGPERKALFPAFSKILESRRRGWFSLYLSIGECPNEPDWKLDGPFEKFDTIREDYHSGTCIGFSSPRGIVTLCTSPHDTRELECVSHFRELEYFSTSAGTDLPIEYLLRFHALKELRCPYSHLISQQNQPVATNFPFLQTLKVLEVWSIQSSILAGQTFHNLERYKEQRNGFKSNTGLLIEMPVCTRAIVDIFSLASLRLPHICELGVYIYDEDSDGDDSNGEDSYGEDSNGEEPNSVWGKHVIANLNPSGLKILQFRSDYTRKMRRTDLIPILRSLPALETLIIHGDYILIPYVEFFKAFVPIQAQDTAGLHQSSGEGRTSGVLCPKLECLQIHGIELNEQPELIPVLDDIITLRTTIGSPLKSFTIDGTYRLRELVGKDGMFTVQGAAYFTRLVFDI